MTAPIHAFDHTVQVTHEWLRELARLLDFDDETRALRVLRVTLQSLRDWIGVEEAAQLGAQLPLLIRGLYYEGWRPARTPTAERSRQAFLERIDEAFRNDPLDDTAEAVCSVFRLLNHHVSKGEVEEARQRLPRHLRELWPEPH